MAPKKKHAEGIALLSMYSDEDDEEMEDAEEDDEQLLRQQEEEDRREVVNMEEEKGEEEREASSRTPGAMDGASGDEEPDGSNRKVVDLVGGEIEGSGDVNGESTDVLDTFLPRPPKQKCSKELQDKISKFLGFKEKGKSFNEEVRRRKDYRNPDFLLHAVSYQDIDQIGSCFDKDVFDPHGYDPSDYYEEIEADMKREQESKKNQKLDFVSVGTQLGNVPAGQKPVFSIPASVGTGLPPISTTADSAARDGKPNKKSKWDKVDGDINNHIPLGTHDSLSSLRANAALLSTANAASGYTAFAQQRRREAGEKRASMERNIDRRS